MGVKARREGLRKQSQNPTKTKELKERKI